MAATDPDAEEAYNNHSEELEATELRVYEHGSHPRTTSPSATSVGANINGGAVDSLPSQPRSRGSPIKLFWKRHVVATVSHDACRDHFALERTYLGYLRTSLALSIVGIVIAQLFRLQHTVNPNQELGFFTLGIPLASTCIVAAMLVISLGCYRFWRQQNAILRGKVHAGGWEVSMVAFITLIVTFAIFLPILVVDVMKK